MNDLGSTLAESAPAVGPGTSDRDARTAAPVEAIRPWIWLCLSLLIVAAVYIGSLDGEFVWDDVALLAGVERALHHGGILQVLARPFWFTDDLEIATRSYYRPLTSLSFALDWVMHQRNSAGYRLTNLVLHLVNTALLFRLCRHQGTRGWLAAALVTCWALQPRLAESVAWISGRTDVLCATFSLGALLLWRPTRGRRLLASSLLFLALLAKETALAAVVAVLLLESSAGTEPLRAQPLRAQLTRCWSPLAALGAFLAVRSIVMLGQVTMADALEPWERPRVAMASLGTYAFMLLDPWQPRTQIGSIVRPSGIASLVGAAIVIAAAWATWQRGVPRRYWQGLTLILVPLVLVSHIIPIATNVVAADRFLYLPTMGLALIAASLANGRRSVAAALAVAMGASFVPVTIARARDWADPIALWTKTGLRASSRNSLALLEVGILEFEAGNLERSNAIFADVSELRDRNDVAEERAATNLAIATSAIGRYRDARTIMEAVVASYPRVPKFWYDAAIFQLRDSDFAAARLSLTRALQLMPAYPEASAVLRALPEYEAAYRRLERGELGWRERAELHALLGFWREAEGEWFELLRATPSVDGPLADRVAEFLLDHGSAAAIERFLAHPARGSARPELLAALIGKRDKAHRLSAIPLKAYGVAAHGRAIE